MNRLLPLLLVLIVAACGTDGGTAAGDPLDGTEWLSVRVTDGGADRPLVEGTRIRLAFTDGQVSASAGCNIIGGIYRIEDGVLAFEGGGMTEMGCDDERHAQDDWLAELLGSRPSIAVDGDELTLTSGDEVVTLRDREVAEPDLPLTGTTWTVDSLITGDAVSSIPDGAVATFTFAEDGTVEVNTGCNEGAGRYTFEDGRLSFTDVVVTERGCDGAAGQLEAWILPFLSAEGIEVSIDAGSMTLMAGDTGLGLRGS